MSTYGMLDKRTDPMVSYLCHFSHQVGKAILRLEVLLSLSSLVILVCIPN